MRYTATTDVESLTHEHDIVAEPNLRHPQVRTFSTKTRISPFSKLAFESQAEWKNKLLYRDTFWQSLRRLFSRRGREMHREFLRVASLINSLFAVEGVEQVMIDQYAVTVILAERFEWDERAGHVKARIYAHIDRLFDESPSS